MGYSFLKQFTKEVKQAEARFSDVPKTFYKADMVHGPRGSKYRHKMRPIVSYICDQLTLVKEGHEGEACQVEAMARELNLIEAQLGRLWGGKGGNRLGVKVLIAAPGDTIKTVVRLRDLIGFYRTYKATGFNAFDYQPDQWARHQIPEGLGEVMRDELSEALGVMLNYHAQSTYITNAKHMHDTTARAWEQKKSPDRELLHLAKVSPLNAYFTHIEID